MSPSPSSAIEQSHGLEAFTTESVIQRGSPRHIAFHFAKCFPFVFGVHLDCSSVATVLISCAVFALGLRCAVVLE
jgi:hypothetical protein